MRRLSGIAGFLLTATLCATTPARAAPLYALVDPAFLLQFDSNAPATITNMVLISGLQQGERIAGIDFRPRTGQLYGLGVGPNNSTLRTYVINPLTGVAQQLPGSSPITVTAGNLWSVDFNPTSDRLRVVNDSGDNLRINPNNGARSDSPTNDTNLNPAGQVIGGIAHDRNFESGFAVVTRTTEFGINVTSSQLVTIGGINQSPSPNGGLISNAMPLGVTLAAGSAVGFDIRHGSPPQAFATLRPAASNLTGLYTINLSTGAATLVGLVGNGSFRIVSLAAPPRSFQAFGAGAGGSPLVKVFETINGAQTANFFAYATFTGGVRVAVGDVNGDGVPDVITGPGPGVGPNIKVYSGMSSSPMAGPLGSFHAFDLSFTGGVYVAAGDVNGDGFKDVIVGAGPGGGPHVRVFSGTSAVQLIEIVAFDPTFTGGVRVAAADFDRDGDAEIVVASGPGTQGRVRVLDASGNPFASAAMPGFVNDFIPYTGYTGGLSVAVGDVNGDGVPDIVTAPDSGPPHVKVFSGATSQMVLEFYAYEASFGGGVNVSVGDVNGDGRLDIVTTPLSGRTVEAKAFDGRNGQLRSRMTPFPGSSAGGYVGGGRE